MAKLIYFQTHNKKNCSWARTSFAKFQQSKILQRSYSHFEYLCWFIMEKLADRYQKLLYQVMLYHDTYFMHALS